MEKKDLGKCSTGMQANVAGLLCYSGGLVPLGAIVSGLIFFLIEKENKFVRFHALQSMITFGALFILLFIPIIGILAAITHFVLWILMMIKAYSGVKFKLPLVGDIAEKNI